MAHRVTRREFSAGLLASSAAIWSARTARAEANDRISVGVIGCRYRGGELAAGFHRSGQFDVKTLCDCDSAMYEKGVAHLKDLVTKPPPLEKDFRRLLDDRGIDAVVLAVPDNWHAIMATMALDAGKHVYVEKPLAFSIDEGRAILAAEQRHPKQAIAVGTQQRSGQHFLDAREFIRSGGLGPVGFARGWLTVQRDVVPKVADSAPPATLDYDMWRGPAAMRPYNASRVHYNWHFMHDTGTGDMGNWGAHWLDSIRQLLDLDVPASAAAMGGQFVVHDAKEFPDTHTVLYEFPNLTVAWEQRHWTSYQMNGKTVGAEIGGAKGTLVIDRSGWVFYPKEGEPQKHPTSLEQEPHILNFAACVRGQAKPAAPVKEAYKSALMIHMGNISLRVGRSLRFDPAAHRFIDDREANAFLGREIRSPWKLPMV